MNDSFVYDRFAEWALLGGGERSRGGRAIRLASRLGPGLLRGSGGLRDRYYAARERALDRFPADTPLSVADVAELRQQLRRRYELSLREGRDNFLNDYVGALDEEADATTLAAFFASTLTALARRYGGGEARVVGEKTPLHTLYADWLLRFQPKARAVLLVRDPVANVASMQRRYGDLERVLRVYDAYARRFLELKTHPRVLVVRQEDLTADTPAAVEGILRFLDPTLGFDATCRVNAYTKDAYTGRQVDAARSGAAREELSPRDRDRIERRFRAVYDAFY